MFKYPLKGILSAVVIRLLDNYRHLSVQLLRIETAKSYLHCLQIARLSTIGLIRTGLLIALICIGVLLFHAGLFILLPWTVEIRAAVSMFLGLIYVVIGGIALRAAMDEKIWMDKSGSIEMMKKINYIQTRKN